MKKINIFLIMLFALTIQSCLHDDKDLFSLSASDRMEERLQENEKTLISAPNGWLMKYYPQSHQIYGGYTLLIKFAEDNSVQIMSERGGATKIEESLYSLTSDSGPVLRFDTFNDLIHYYAEPKNPDGIGPDDSGMQGDFEFVIIEATDTRVTLKGKKTGNTIIMEPIPADVEWGSIMTPILEIGNDITSNARYKFTMDGFEANVKQSFRQLTFDSDEADQVIDSYIITESGVEFYEPLVINGVTISTFKYVKNGEESYLFDEASGAKLIPMYADLYTHLLADYWSFTYSKTENYSRTVFNAIKQRLDATNIELFTVFLGPSSQFDFRFTLFLDEEGESDLTDITYYLNANVSDNNIMQLEFSGYIGGDKTNDYHNPLGFNYLLGLVIGKFQLTADNPKKPNYIKFVNLEDEEIAFTLKRGMEIYPYDN